MGDFDSEGERKAKRDFICALRFGRRVALSGPGADKGSCNVYVTL